MKKRLVLILLAAVLLIGLVLAGVVVAHEAKALTAQMQGVWYRDGGEDWHLEIEVREGEMEYRFVSAQFPEMSEVIYTYGLEPLTGKAVRVEYPDTNGKKIITVTVTDRKMEFSPAITTAMDSETWTRQ